MPASKRIPKKILAAMKEAGGNVDKIPGEDLSQCNIKYRDSAWDIYEEWASSVEADPLIGAAFAPGPAIGYSALCPPTAMAGAILAEANSIVVHYAPLLAASFAGGAVPNIPPPIPFPPTPTAYQHPKAAMSVLMQRIQTPPANYPILSSLRADFYICTIMQIWANAVVLITLSK